MMKAEPALPSTTQMASTDDSQYDNPPPPAYSGPSTSSTTAAPSVVHTSQCRDPLFAVLFLLQLLAVLVIGWYCYGHDAGSSFANNGNASGSASLATGQTYGSWMILAIDIGIALIASYLVLFLTKAQPKLMIWLSLIYMLVMSLFGLILAARNGSATGVVFAVIAFALTAYFVYCVRNRIDFTARLLTVTIAFTEAFPSAYLVIMAGNALQVGWVWLFFFCAGSIVTSLNDYTGASQSLIYFVYFCLALSFYWTSEVIKNLTIVATSGIVATWYFLYPQNTPSQVALPAIGRACTYSLGSIAEGSLIVAVIKCVQLLLNLVIQQMQQQGDNIVAVCLVQVLNLLIGFFNGLLQSASHTSHQLPTPLHPIPPPHSPFSPPSPPLYPSPSSPPTPGTSTSTRTPGSASTATRTCPRRRRRGICSARGGGMPSSTTRSSPP